jgi:hypothetical protein
MASAKKGLLAGLASAVVVAACALVFAPAPRTTVLPLYGAGDANASCGGVMVAPMRLLTAAHCVSDGAKMEAGPNHMPLKILRLDAAKDLALAAVAIDCPCAPIATDVVEVDEPVLVIGYPLNDTLEVQVATEGRAQGYASLGSSRSRLRTTAPVMPGNSGGGLFVRRRFHWELAGISHALVLYPAGKFSMPVSYLTIFVQLSDVREFLQHGDAPNGMPQKHDTAESPDSSDDGEE